MLEPDGNMAFVRRVDMLVRDFVLIRGKIEATYDIVKKFLAPYEAKKEQLTEDLLAALEQTGAEMMRTKHGTVSKLLKSTASLHDPDAFMAFVVEQEQFELLERRANVTACREYADEHDGALPPGVKMNVKRYVGVRTS
jgi:hypothetical protein